MPQSVPNVFLLTLQVADLLQAGELQFIISYSNYHEGAETGQLVKLNYLKTNKKRINQTS